MHRRVLHTEIPATATPFMEAANDFVFGEVWSRPGLDARARRLVTLSCVAGFGWSPAIDAYVAGALKSGDFSAQELREFALHLGVYAGWPAGAQVDLAISRVDVSTSSCVENFAASHDHRRANGQARARSVLVDAAPIADCALRGVGELDFVYGEVWNRPGLDRRSRRWITLSCVGLAGARGPIEEQVRAALESADISRSELDEFALNFAVYAGWPKASVLQAAVEVASQCHNLSAESGKSLS